MGKSACARLLLERGVRVIDTDELARRVVEPGQPALAEVAQAFGPGVLGPDGRLRRDELGRRVFADPAARKRLEGMLHPRIRELWRREVAEWQRQTPDRGKSPPIAVVIIPLLFETGAEGELDATVCIACSAATQEERLLARGWSAEGIGQRIGAQWPVEKKMAAADYVIWTEGSLEVHAAQLKRILEHLEQPGTGSLENPEQPKG